MPITDRVAPLRTNLVPPPGAEAAGVTPTGKQLYTLTRKMARSKPKLDEKGNPVFRRSPTTGEALPGMPQLRVPEIYEEEQLFYLESDGHGNVHKIMWTPPSEEELLAAKRRQQVETMKDQLAGVLVDEGITSADELRAMFRGERTVAAPAEEPAETEEDDGADDGEPEPDPIEDIDFDEYPKYLKVGTWELCDGEVVGGPGDQALKKADAQELNGEAQAKLEAAAEARANVDTVPEF